MYCFLEDLLGFGGSVCVCCYVVLVIVWFGVFVWFWLVVFGSVVGVYVCFVCIVGVFVVLGVGWWAVVYCVGVCVVDVVGIDFCGWIDFVFGFVDLIGSYCFVGGRG